MHIFVDESGNFTVQVNAQPYMCCVAALAVSESGLVRLQALHSRLLRAFRPAGGELKGRALTAPQLNRVLRELARIDVVPIIVAMDMGLQDEASISAHKRGQAANLRQGVEGPEHLDSMRHSVDEVATQIEHQSNQLYVQAFVQTEAIARTYRVATMHFAQTDPSTLGSFVWRVDAKDRETQECERLWAVLVKPFLQDMFLRRPFAQVHGAGFDYSAMERFDNPDQDVPPDHLRAAVRRIEGPFQSNDLNGILADLAFEDSRSSAGVQFADIVASVFCRACNGRLEPSGWRRLGGLMIRHFEDGQAVSYVSMRRTNLRPIRLEYGRVVTWVESQARDFQEQRARPRRSRSSSADASADVGPS